MSQLIVILLAETNFRIGRCLFDMNKPEEAKAFLQTALPIYEKSLPDVIADRDVANTNYWIVTRGIPKKNFKSKSASG